MDKTATFLDHQHFGVLGAGRSGQAAARLLRQMGRQVTLIDEFADPGNATFEAMTRQGVALAFGPRKGLPGDVEALVVSPGIDVGHPLLKAAEAAGIPVRGEIELGYLCAPGARIIAVTGTNGKTTVTMLIERLLCDAGIEAIAAGNIGHAFCDAVADNVARLSEIVFVLEVSSFQLETVDQFAPDVALVLNVTPDHLDRHSTMAQYIEAKSRITRRQGAGQTLIVNQDDPGCLGIAVGQTEARVCRFSLERPVEDGGWLDGDLLMICEDGQRPRRYMSMSELGMIGLHNVANALAAAIAARLMGCSRTSIIETLRSFKAAPHRMQLVASGGGVQFIDDSKATNLDSMLKAVSTFSGGLHLIAGGRDKASPFNMLTEHLASRVKAIYLIGEAAEPMEAAWGERMTCLRCGTMDQALETSTARAVEGDIVLLSPGCASFDQFRSYAHRGDVFAAWVREYVERVSIECEKASVDSLDER